jgi:predicted Zn finger-like uncharacterized protein
MIVSCPSCKSKYKVDENKVPDQGLKLKCPKCTTSFKVLKPAPQPAAVPAPAPAPAPAPPAASPPPQAVAAKPPAKPLAPGPYKPQVPSLGTVLIGDSDEVFLKQLARTLLQAGYTLYLAQDGEAAINLIKTKLPKVAIVDVALPKVFGFDIAEQVKKDPNMVEKVRVILLGSVHEKGRYRREPESFYGADEYIEKHHDVNEILEKVKALMTSEMPPKQPVAPAPAPAPAPPAAPAAAPPQAPAPTPAAAQPEQEPVPDDKDHKKAARLARTIVSDIVLYNPDLVDRGIKEGNLYDLLAKDIQDGIKHYNNRVPESVRAVRNYYKEAFDALVVRKKAELGL